MPVIILPVTAGDSSRNLPASSSTTSGPMVLKAVSWWLLHRDLVIGVMMAKISASLNIFFSAVRGNLAYLCSMLRCTFFLAPSELHAEVLASCDPSHFAPCTVHLRPNKVIRSAQTSPCLTNCLRQQEAETQQGVYSLCGTYFESLWNSSSGKHAEVGIFKD